VVKKGIAFGHIIHRDGIEVDKSKSDLIVNLSSLTYFKEVRFFLYMQAAIIVSRKTLVR